MAGIVSGLKTFDDYRRADEEFQLRKKEKLAELEAAKYKMENPNIGTPPAALQLANEYQKRVAAGDQKGADLLAQFAKTVDRGVISAPDGGYMSAPGYDQLLAAREAAKTGAKEQTQANIERSMAPGTAGLITAAQEAEKVKRAAELERQKKVGSAEGDTAADLVKKETSSINTTELARRAKELLPESTAGGAAELYKKGAGFFGKSTKESPVDRKLNVLAATLTANVPRFEGPQGVLDVEFYKQAAGDLANSKLPEADRMAAADEIIRLQKKYLPEGYIEPTNIKEDIPTGGKVYPAEAAAAKLKFNPDTLPMKAAQALRGNPALAEQFDAKYGRGAAKFVLGN